MKVFTRTKPGLRLRTTAGSGESGPERHATWLELFVDLVFVVAIAELAHGLHAHLTPGGLAGFAALFVAVWWQWIDFSYFADQFDTDDRPAYLTVLTFVIMFGVIVLALTIKDALGGHGSLAFGAAYAGLRAIITGMYAAAWRAVPESRELAGRYALSFVVALVIWIASLFAPPPLRFVLWGVALFIEISNGPLTYATIKNVPQQVSHMDERFGLFVLIVLGETIVSVATGVSGTAWQARAVFTAAAGFALTACLWWLFFERADSAVIHRALRGGKRDLLLSYVYGYSHLFVFVGTVAAGVGVQTAIEAAAHRELMSLSARAALCGGLAVFLLGIALVHWSGPGSLTGRILAARLAVVLLCFALLLAGAALPTLVLSGLLAAALIALTGWETRCSSLSASTPVPSPADGRGVPETRAASASRQAVAPLMAGTPLPSAGEGTGVEAAKENS